MAYKPVYLTEREIRGLEALNEFALAEELELPGAAGTVIRLLRSYRIASTVANCAWRVEAALQKGPIPEELLQDLRRALHLYAPNYFEPEALDAAYGYRLLQELYDALEAAWDAANPPRIFHVLFMYIEEMRGRIRK